MANKPLDTALLDRAIVDSLENNIIHIKEG